MTSNFNIVDAVKTQTNVQELEKILKPIQEDTSNKESTSNQESTSDSKPKTDQEKIREYLDYLSQVMSLEGPSRGKFESVLKSRLFEAAKIRHEETQTIIKDDSFKYDSNLSDTIKKLDYLSRGIRGYHNKVTNYVAKLIHHFRATYGENKHFGASYLAVGAGFFVSNGLMVIMSDDPTTTSDDNKTIVAWGSVAFGGVLILAPILYSFYLATNDEP